MTFTPSDLANFENDKRRERRLRKAAVKKIKGVKERKKVSRVGKLGIVRLYGKDLEQLRSDCFDRDGYLCRECGRRVSWDGEWWIAGTAFLPRGEMAHIQSRGAGGSDTLDNVRTLCPECHAKEHQYGKDGQKPCPAKH